MHSRFSVMAHAVFNRKKQFLSPHVEGFIKGIGFEVSTQLSPRLLVPSTSYVENEQF